MAKSWILIFAITILQLKTFKTQYTTKSTDLIHFELYDSLAERINNDATGMFTYCEKSSNPVRGRFFIA